MARRHTAKRTNVHWIGKLVAKLTAGAGQASDDLLRSHLEAFEEKCLAL